MEPFVLTDSNGKIIGQSHPNIAFSLAVKASKSINFVNWQAEKLEKIKSACDRQNNFSFLKKIDIKSEGTEDINEARLSIRFLPDCLHCDDVIISCLEHGKTTTVDTFHMAIDPAYLYGLGEAILGTMSVTLMSQDGQTLATSTQNIDILPIEESASEDRVNEILVSFVTPNDDLVRELAEQAAKQLEAKYHRSDFAGYQYGDPNKVVEELDAIYLAITNAGIHYSNPPASFEKTFQRIRLPRTVLSEKTATCLDFALLAASVMENVGLHPLIIVIDGHAFCGCWLADETFPNGLIDNSTLVLNYASEGWNRLYLFDPTNAAAGSAINFAQSKENGYHELQEADPFLYALDIVRCRQENIRPIPTPHNINGQTTLTFDSGDRADYVNEPIDQTSQGILEDNSHGQKNKFDVWEEKLLDLNMRNNLINLHLGGGNCQILCADAIALYDKLQSQSTFSLWPQSSEPVHDSRFVAFESNKTDSEDLKRALGQNAFYVVSANGLPDRNLVALSRKANTEIEESGCNPLFLTVGAIRWFDNDNAALVGKMSFTSPILLIPAHLPRRRSGPYYQLELDLDGIQFNTTVFEYFKQNLGLDFSEFDNLFAEKDSVIDLQKIYNTIRSKIFSKHGWAVLDNFVCLSMFSFAHFVMWSDLKNYRDIFLKNPIVASLTAGRQEWQDPVNPILPQELDLKLNPQDLAIPLSADSSQIQAIAASEAGESFVLDGPPGTGKSQTIANMIINFMFHQKTVLFVAEKEVALDVVKTRLDRLGLGKFCLQISSAKANKKDVLTQLQQALDLGQTKNPEAYQQEAEALKAERDALNHTLASLHQSKSFFVSIYSAILGYLAVSPYGGRTSVDEAYARKMNSAAYEEVLKALKTLALHGQAIGSYYRNPFIPFQNRNYSMEQRDALLSELIPYQAALTTYQNAAASFFSAHLPDLAQSQANLQAVEAALLSLRQNNRIAYPYLANDEYFAKRTAIMAFLNRALETAKTRDELKQSLQAGAFALDGPALAKRNLEARGANIFKRFSIKQELLREFKPFAVTKKAVRGKTLDSLIAQLVHFQELTSSLAAADAFIRFVYPKEAEQSVEAILQDQAAASATFALHQSVMAMAPKANATLATTWSFFSSLGAQAAVLFAPEVSAFLSAKQSFDALSASLKQRYAFDFFFDRDEDDYLSHHNASLRQAIAHSGALAEWSAFLQALDQAAKLLPANFLKDYQAGSMKEDELEPCFKAALFYRIVALGLGEEKLANLSAVTTDQEIAFYKQQIDKFNALTIAETAARVTAHYPSNGTNFASSTQIYQLRHLCANGGRGKTLRGIFQEFGELIHQICPCFLMSPLAVSQYLEPGKHYFDAVVFDEASQIQTSEAIAPLARGHSLIVAGDQQQMPPTNFFAAGINLGDEDDDNDALAYDDLESFLDDCIALHLPRIRLNCHYRSNHESLIAFSNNRFYDNSLLTFPSPTNQTSKVSFRYVGGVYQKGKGINREEASAIVSEVLRRLHDPELKKKSIGIITFNEKQQDLVLDLLDKQVYSKTDLESNPGGESIFVKNLENVQGDERDVILFSICFGPDPKTKTMVLNFGPLSRERGERRLNVAVSRAREEMMVFASTQPEDIRAEQAKNEGAEFLRSFLRYAKYGVTTLTNSASGTIYAPEKSVADYLAQDLIRKGLAVDTNVGSSSFRIDLAIKDPTNPASYRLGIICDSACYSQAATCRDRNVVEPSMLERLHWRILHVWSVEYFDHPALVVQRILSALKETPSTPTPTSGNVPLDLAVLFQKKEIPDEEKYPHKVAYEYYHPNPWNYGNIAPDIVTYEGPISRTLLEKRYRQTMKIGRIGNNIAWTIDNALRKFYRETYDGETYYWPTQDRAAFYTKYRVGSDRSTTDIPFQEFAAAATDIIALQGAMSFDDLLKQISLLFGLSALKEKTRNHFQTCLEKTLVWPASKLQRSADGLISLKA